MIAFMLDGGLFMIPINLAGLAILLLGLERLYSLFIKKDHAQANLGRRLLSLRFLGLLTGLTGVIGTAMGLFQAFSARDRIPEPFPIYEVCRIALSTTIWGLTLSLVALIIYYVVKAKAERIREMRLS